MGQGQVSEKFQLLLMRIYKHLASVQKGSQRLPSLEEKLRTESANPYLGK